MTRVYWTGVTLHNSLGLPSSESMLTAAVVALLHRRTGHRCIGAEDATVARFWLQYLTASEAIVEERTRVDGHRFHGLVPAQGAIHQAMQFGGAHGRFNCDAAVGGRPKPPFVPVQTHLGSTKANSAPTVVQSSAIAHKPQLTRRSRVHAAARAGSAGHGSVRACHRIAPDSASMPNATPNTTALCSDSQISCGTAVTNPASAAPAPKATITAGSAQQIKVPPLASRVTAATPKLRRKGACATSTSFMGRYPLANGVQ